MSAARPNDHPTSFLMRASQAHQRPGAPDRGHDEGGNRLLAALAEKAAADRHSDPEIETIHRSLRDIRDMIDALLADRKP